MRALHLRMFMWLLSDISECIRKRQAFSHATEAMLIGQKEEWTARAMLEGQKELLYVTSHQIGHCLLRHSWALSQSSLPVDNEPYACQSFMHKSDCNSPQASMPA